MLEKIMDPRLVLTVLCAAAELFTFCRFVRARVHVLLPWFTLYLLAGFAQSFIWLAGSPTSRSYANAYALTTPAIIALQIVAFIELWCKLMPRSVSDRATRGLGMMIVAVAVVLGLLTGVDGLALHLGLSRRMLFMWISWIVRYSATVLCIATSFLAVCALFLEGRPSRYVMRHGSLLSAYFASIAAGYLAINLNLVSVPLVGAITVGSATGLYILWSVLLPGYAEQTQPVDRVVDGSPHGSATAARTVPAR